MKSCVGTSPGLGGGLFASFLASFCCSDFSWRDSNRRRFQGRVTTITYRHPTASPLSTLHSAAKTSSIRAVSCSNRSPWTEATPAPTPSWCRRTRLLGSILWTAIFSSWCPRGGAPVRAKGSSARSEPTRSSCHPGSSAYMEAAA